MHTKTVARLFQKWAASAYAGGIGASRGTSLTAFAAGHEIGRRCPRYKFVYVLVRASYSDYEVAGTSFSSQVASRWKAEKDPNNWAREVHEIKMWHRLPKENTPNGKKLRETPYRNVRRTPAGKR